ncbi:MAG TPA: sugar porter family MFS transporter [bacterium]|jgi:sugar porter (SP) family MFS transporter|nr:sugar porter family MFS transporter [bacterium]HNT65652.1 sugar porter family MFS transporter [bacterium]HOX86125.1 sugar porter family MFS transporter [bacterium]HPG45661.1 sugar porter family MFS transporter [bacterium]HPM97560.1 sugar porter family MFS transporter [bacterium]
MRDSELSTLQSQGSVVYLTAISLVAALGGFLFGYDTAVISGTVGFVKTQFALDALMEGWFVASALVGCIAGVSFAGVLSDWSGRKIALLLSAVLFTLSAVGCTVAQSQNILILYRFIGGLGVGVASMLSPLYISEVSAPHLRGRLVALYQFAITIGILCAYFADAALLKLATHWQGPEDGFWYWIVHQEVWRSMFGSETVPAVLFFLLLFLVPESPRWLAAHGSKDKARAVLARVSGDRKAERQMEEIEVTLKLETDSRAGKSGFSLTLLEQLFRPGFRTAMLIGIALAILSQLTGINAIIYYGPRIFTLAGLNVADSLDSQVIIGVVNVLFTLLAIWKIDTFGRRGLLLTGISGMFFFLLVIGLFFLVGLTRGLWLLIPMLLYIACFAFSIGPVIWTLLSEIYPTTVRGTAMSVATFALWTGTFIIGQGVPWLLENLGATVTFWLFALMCVPAFLITLKKVPETKGKTLEEIEHHWLRG